MNKIQDNKFYIMINNHKHMVCRYYGKLPNGAPSMGFWGVLRIDTGDMIDWCQYLNDLKSKYSF